MPATKLPDALDGDTDELAAALRFGIGLLVRRLRQQQQALDELTLPETSALARLDRGGPATATDLARAEQISPQSMGATIAALAARGLVERRPDPHDGRRSLLSLSVAGRAALAGHRTARTERLARALARDFTSDERARLAAAAPLIERLALGIR
jgi:DNA-binding MarR family transcriptional regulator